MWWWKGVAWSLVLVLVPSVWGQDCVSEDVQIWKFPVGENAIISLKGDTDQGCKFVLQNDETKSCCYMNKARQDKPLYNMCVKHPQSETCINKTRFTVHDNEPVGHCTLNVTNFEASDAGQYNVKFLSESNKIKRVDIRVKKTELIRRIDIGESDTIVVGGDIKEEEGCNFVVTLDSTKICCHESNPVAKLCNETKTSKGCKNNKVTIDGKKCILYIENFQASDTGNYEAIFPSDREDNEIVHVKMPVKMPEKVPVESMIFVIVGVTVIVFTALFFGLKRIKQNIEFRIGLWITSKRTKDKAILDALRSGDKEVFKEKLGNRSILKVSDHYQNNIFHIAADIRWTKEMDDIVISHCKEIFPPRGGENPDDIELEPLRRKYIFSAEIPTSYQNQININTQNLESMTPLHIAVGNNLEDAVMSLLENRADPNIQDKDGYTALQKAILYQPCSDDTVPDNIQTVKNLLGQNPNLDNSVHAKLTATGEGQNPLHSAVLKNNLNVIRLIFEEQERGRIVCPKIKFQNGERGRLMQNLLNEKWKQKKDNLETPIELAVRLGRTSIVRFFLDECQRFWCQNDCQTDCPHVMASHVMQLISRAAGGGHIKIVDLLLADKYGKKFDPEYTIDEDTCLERAIKAKNPVVVTMLLKRIVDVDVGKSVAFTEHLIKTEVAYAESVNKDGRTLIAENKSRMKLNMSDSEETKMKEEKYLKSCKDIVNLNKIKSDLQNHGASGSLDPPIANKKKGEKGKKKLSEETVIEQLKEIMASENRLSQRHIIHLQIFLRDRQVEDLGEQA